MFFRADKLTCKDSQVIDSARFDYSDYSDLIEIQSILHAVL